MNPRRSGKSSVNEMHPESGQNDNSIQQVIDKLKQQKFLNDEEFAKSWVRSRKSYKPKGERLIRQELKQKGITREIIERVFKNSDGEKSDLELAKDILVKKRTRFETMERQERFNKAGSLLARRGFDFDEIKRAIDEVFGNLI